MWPKSVLKSVKPPAYVSMLSDARRVRAVLRDGRLPEVVPANTIWQRVNRREWQLTIHPF